MDLRYQVVLGDVYLQHGRLEEAYDTYQKVLAIEPDNPMAVFSMASYYEQKGEKDLYNRQLDMLLLNKKVDDLTKVNVMRQIIVESEQAGKDSTEVIALFDKLMTQDMDNAQIPMLYAQYLLSKNMEAASVPVLEQVVNLDPANKAARLMLISSAVKKEDYRQIIRICEAGHRSYSRCFGSLLLFGYRLQSGGADGQRAERGAAGVGACHSRYAEGIDFGLLCHDG